MTRLRTTQWILLGCVALLAVVGIFGLTDLTFAQADALGLQEIEDSNLALDGGRSVQQIVAGIINIFLSLLGIIALGLFVYGGFLYMTSGGAPERVDRAKQLMINATIGLVIILSSWAITRFIINRLSDATGSGGNVEQNDPERDPNCPGLGLCNPNGGGGPIDDCLAQGEHFVVKSISPNTERTGMTNTAVRVIFSQNLPNGADPADFVTVSSTRTGLPVDPSDAALFYGYVAQLRFDDQTAACNGQLSCLAPDTYVITVNEDVVDANGRPLELQNECGDFPSTATFTNDVDALDQDAPRSDDGVVVNGVSQHDVDENGFILQKGRRYAITATHEDRREAFANELFVGGEMNQPPFDNVPAFVGVWGNPDVGLINNEVNDPVNGDRALQIRQPDDHAGVVLTPGEVLVPGNDYLLSFDYVIRGGRMITWVSAGDINTDFEDAAETIEAPPIVGSYERRFTVPAVEDGEQVLPVVTVEGGVLNIDNISLRRVLQAQGGVAGTLLEISLENEDGRQDQIAPWVVGPRVQDGTDAPYDFFYQLFVGDGIPTPSRYTVRMSTTDIDGNLDIEEAHIIIVADHCLDDEPENDDDQCLADGACNADWQCRSRQCVDGQCVAAPMITEVNPTWDGSPGNLITIRGQFFGEEQGQVHMAVPQDDGEIAEDAWKLALPPAQCQFDMWNDNEVVVTIPSDFNPGDQIALRVTRAVVAGGADPLFDISTDDHGPKSGPNSGLFTVNETIRPGLCGFSRAGVPTEGGRADEQILATGVGFGDIQGRLNVGGFEADIVQWANQGITFSVPRIESGRVGVFAQIGEVRSNGRHFTVQAEEFVQENQPIITAIDPGAATPLSMITLLGRNFGSQTGEVFLGESAEAVANCPQVLAEANGAFVAGGCVKLSFALPEACGQTWFDDHIIGLLPEGAPAGEYNMMVRTNGGDVSSGDARFRIDAGDPLPGICRITPDNGPAPLQEDDDPIIITGRGFQQGAVAYYSTRGFVENDLDTWLSSELNDPQGNPVLGDIAAESIETRLPERVNDDETKQSLDLGPSRIRVAVGDNLTNSGIYTVNDCRQSDDELPGYHCCTQGADQGRWVSNGQACEGERREGGYLWRFSTGLIPRIPSVVESCEEVDWGNRNPNVQIPIPSPVPWIQNRQGDQACLNASLVVRFSIAIDEESLRNRVNVFTCVDDNGSIDCEGDNKVPVPFELENTYDNKVLTIHRGNVAPLAPETWYRVELSEGIQSAEQVMVLGEPQTLNFPLRASRPCGDGTAYCYEFKTGQNNCGIVAAGVYPEEHTVRELGQVHDPRFPRRQAGVRNVGANFVTQTPLLYLVWGRGDRVCNVIDVDGYGWQWSTQGDPAATVERYVTGGRVDSQATATALQDAPLGVLLHATLDSDVHGQHDATSHLIINLADPAVQEWWPSCTESCTNAEIGVRFNRMMITDHYDRGFIVQRCASEECNLEGEDIGRIPLEIDDANPFVLSAQPERLEEGVWYRATVKDTIRSIGAIREELDEEGNAHVVVDEGPAVAPFSWKFRTKRVDGNCQIERVAVNPHPYIARNIGEKTRYQAVPFSSPNECSPNGQRLNPWEYGWEWSVQDEAVVSITTNESAGREPAYCTEQCLAAGADIPRGVEEGPLCGNGVVDAGEDCDIGVDGERAGVSCTYSCLRPGVDPAERANADGTITLVPGGTCGDGNVDVGLGEECDPGAQNLPSATCSVRCLNAGSSQEESEGALDVAICGSGEVTGGEECDIALTLEDIAAHNEANPGDQWPVNYAQNGCSATCQHRGTDLSAAWCVQNSAYGNDNNFVGSRNACNVATSQCGNGVIERGEECEIIDVDTVRFVGDAERDVDVRRGSSFYCSDTCLAQNVCGLDIPRVDEGGVGCDVLVDGAGCSLTQCRILGSSVLYDDPSLCGNWEAGAAHEIGEYQLCEENLFVGEGETLGQNPIQVAIARGDVAGDLDDEPLRTQIRAQATHLRDEDGSRRELLAPLSGVGDYSLQCGYQAYGVRDLLEGRDGAMVQQVRGFWEVTTDPADAVEVSVEKVIVPDDVDHELHQFGAANSVLVFGNDAAAHTISQHELPLRIGQRYQLSFDGKVLAGDEVQNLRYAVEVRRLGQDNYEVATSGVLGRLPENAPLRVESEVFTAFGSFNDVRIVFETAQGMRAAIDNVRMLTINNLEDGLGQQNDCPGNELNRLGVASNSCCYPRPMASVVYPNVEGDVCLNSAIYVEFEGTSAIDQSTVFGNVQLLEGYVDPGTSCEALGQVDVTAEVNRLRLAQATYDDITIFGKIWQGIKRFFAGLFGQSATAALGDAQVWCSGRQQVQPRLSHTVDPETNGITSRITVGINSILEPGIEYGVMLLGGPTGIKNERGVSIMSRNPGEQGTHLGQEFYTFTTGEDVCRISGVKVEPEEKLFIAPEQVHGFTAEVISETNGQQIQPVAEYGWVWKWVPRNNPLYDIPFIDEDLPPGDAEGPLDDGPSVNIRSTLIEGTLAATAQVTIDRDISGEDLGRQFSAVTELRSFFCANPWPSDAVSYEDNDYNFSMSYCADAGRADTRDDDLPHLTDPSYAALRLAGRVLGDLNNNGVGDAEDIQCYRDLANDPQHECLQTDFFLADINCSGEIEPNEWGEALGADQDRNGIPDCAFENNINNELVSEDTLQRLLFFNDKNADIIGVQIFANPKNDAGRIPTAAEWFADKFTQARPLQPVAIDGYEGITDGNNYYIAALNQVNTDGGREVFSNVYHFSINENAQSNTREVFGQLIESILFNINIPEYRYCLSDQVVMDGVALPRDHAVLTGLAIQGEDAISCTNDFDCRDAFGAPVEGSNGFCANAKTKFLNDWTRLHTIQSAQAQLEQYRFNQTFYPKLAGGTFIPQYSNEQWQSWGLLPNLGSDPVGGWSACGRCSDTIEDVVNGQAVERVVSCTSDAQCPGQGNICELQDSQTCWDPDTANYICPAFSNLLEYATVNGQNYTLHGRLEYFNQNESIVTGADGFIDPAHFTTEPWCQPEVVHSPFAGRCGDGVVNIGQGEQCDPPGTIVRTRQGVAAVQAGRCEGNNAACQGNADCADDIGRVRGVVGDPEFGEVIQAPFRSRFEGYCAVARGGEEVGLAFDVERSVVNVADLDNSQLIGLPCREDIDCRPESPSPFLADEQRGGVGGTIFVSEVNNFISALTPGVHPEDQYTEEQFLQEFNQDGYQTICSDRLLRAPLCVGAELVEQVLCEEGQTAPAFCNNSCQYEYGQCEAGGFCGDGQIQSPNAEGVIETCDDGARNGEYGQCNENCQGRVAASCGNGYVDFVNPQGAFERASRQNDFQPGVDRALEFCDEVEGICSFLDNDVGRIAPNVYILLDQSGSMGGRKWNQATEGLYQIADQFDSISEEHRVDLNVSLSIFGDRNGCPALPPNNLGADNVLGGPGRVEGTQAPRNEDSAIRELLSLQESGEIGPAFRAALGPINPTTFTPTASALHQFRVREMHKKLEGGRRVVDPQDEFRQKTLILVTDGDPGCGGGGNHPVENVPNVIYEIDKIKEELGIETYVIGFNVDENNEEIEGILNILGDYEGLTLGQKLTLFAQAGGTERARSANSAEQLVSEITQILGCESYSHKEGNTCAADCQSFGGYCGDGIVNAGSPEQCDDGNRNNTDACDNNCKRRVPAPPRENDPAGRCGDGIVQEGENADGIVERCDLGDFNGIACNPAYEQSCNYCSRDCREVVKVDPVAYCGNGRLDRRVTLDEFAQLRDRPDIAALPQNQRSEALIRAAFEYCDFDGGNLVRPDPDELVQNAFAVVFAGEEIPAIDVAVCEDVGTPMCSPDCSDLDYSGCDVCELTQGEANPVPSVAFLNVLGENNAYDRDDKIVALARLKDGKEDFLAADLYRNLQSGYATLLSENQVDEGFRLESNLLCKEEYSLVVVPGNNIPNWDDNQWIDWLNRRVEEKAAGVFPYPTANEIRSIDNELIVSPALPAGYMRMIISWDKNVDPGVEFVGNVYNSNFPDRKIITYADLQGRNRGLCSSMAVFNAGIDYLSLDDKWLPINCEDHGYRIWVSRIVEGEKYKAQAVTLYVGLGVNADGEINRGAANLQNNTRIYGDVVTAQQREQHAPYAFFVQAISNTGASIANYAAMDVRVHTYKPKSGETPASIIPPAERFYTLNRARRSENPIARYWHVFNITPEVVNPLANVQIGGIGGGIGGADLRRYIEYRPTNVNNAENGVITTDFVDIECNVPNGICRRDL